MQPISIWVPFHKWMYSHLQCLRWHTTMCRWKWRSTRTWLSRNINYITTSTPTSKPPTIKYTFKSKCKQQIVMVKTVTNYTYTSLFRIPHKDCILQTYLLIKTPTISQQFLNQIQQILCQFPYPGSSKKILFDPWWKLGTPLCRMRWAMNPSRWHSTYRYPLKAMVAGYHINLIRCLHKWHSMWVSIFKTVFLLYFNGSKEFNLCLWPRN